MGSMGRVLLRSIESGERVRFLEVRVFSTEWFVSIESFSEFLSSFLCFSFNFEWSFKVVFRLDEKGKSESGFWRKMLTRDIWFIK